MFQNKEREQAILGSIIIEEKLLFNLDIEKEDFYNINNETIFSTIVEMNKQTKKIDFITLKAELENKKELQKI
jgi:replicative DNA helicase